MPTAAQIRYRQRRLRSDSRYQSDEGLACVSRPNPKPSPSTRTQTRLAREHVQRRECRGRGRPSPRAHRAERGRLPRPENRTRPNFASVPLRHTACLARSSFFVLIASGNTATGKDAAFADYLDHATRQRQLEEDQHAERGGTPRAVEPPITEKAPQYKTNVEAELTADEKERLNARRALRAASVSPPINLG
jgi:hypothetical protein